MKNIVTGTRGIPDIIGCVEPHSKELLPRIASSDGYDVTVIRRSNYVNDSLTATPCRMPHRGTEKQPDCVFCLTIFSLSGKN